MTPELASPSHHAREGQFHTTRWSVVRRAMEEGGGAAAEAALSALCRTYWYPLYVYFRRAGRSAHDAEDLTQGLFVRLLAKGAFAVADPVRGRLRSFLLTCARHYMQDEYQRAQAQKRGAELMVPAEAQQAEERYAREPVDQLSPDRLFQRRWAMAVLESSLATVQEEFAAGGKAALFATLRPFLGFEVDSKQRYQEVCTATGMPIGTIKNHVFRLRKRWREVLFATVANTLEDPSEEEIKHELGELLGSV